MKQAQMDMEAELDVEAGLGGILNPKDQENLSQFFHEVSAIKADVAEITLLSSDLQSLNEEAKSTHSSKILRGLRDRMESDMSAVLRKTRVVKARLESLDRSNVISRKMSVDYREGSAVDRTRMSITAGLRVKLRDLMCDFQSLREKILADHKEDLKRRYYSAVGEMPTEEDLEKMIFGSGKVAMFEGKSELEFGNKVRHEAVMGIQRSLTKLHQVFLDMAVLVEAQGEQIDNIEENVAIAGQYISGGTNSLHYAKQMKKKNNKWVLWLCAVVVIIFLVCLISMDEKAVKEVETKKLVTEARFVGSPTRALPLGPAPAVFPLGHRIGKPRLAEYIFLFIVNLYLLFVLIVGLVCGDPAKDNAQDPAASEEDAASDFEDDEEDTASDFEDAASDFEDDEEDTASEVEEEENTFVRKLRQGFHIWRASLFSQSNFGEELKKLANSFWFVRYTIRVVYVCCWVYMVIGGLLFWLVVPILAVHNNAMVDFLPPNSVAMENVLAAAPFFAILRINFSQGLVSFRANAMM